MCQIRECWNVEDGFGEWSVSIQDPLPNGVWLRGGVMV